jgi:hypothetical protein
MKNYNAGAVLKPVDYARHSQLGLILSLGLGAVVFMVGFVVPLLS